MSIHFMHSLSREFKLLYTLDGMHKRYRRGTTIIRTYFYTLLYYIHVISSNLFNDCDP